MSIIKNKLALLIASTLAVSAGFVGVFGSGATAVADTNYIFVNNANFGTNGTCTAGIDSYDRDTPTNNQCSLGAALTLANSLGSSQMTVTLATEFAAAGGGDIQIPSSPSTAQMMDSAWAGNSLATHGAYYVVAVPMTIDLKNELGIVASGDQKYTTLAITGTGVNLLNASNIQSGMSAIVVASTASNVLIDGGATLPSNGNWTNQFLVIQNGASNVTFRNYTVGNLSNGSDDDCVSTAICFVPGPGSVSLVAQNILVDNVTFTSTRSASNTACNGTNSTGCVNNSFVFLQNSHVSGLEIRNSTFSNLKKGTDNDSVILAGGWIQTSLSGLDFHGNTIRNSGSCVDYSSTVCSLIRFDPLVLSAKDDEQTQNFIRNNSFINDSSLKQPHAIAAKGSTNGVGESHLTISDNYFDGFVASTIWVYTLGRVTVSRNEIGPNSYSNPTTMTADGEPFVNSVGTAGSMFANPWSGNYLNTWYPTSVSMSWTAGQCQVSMDISAPSNAVTGNKPYVPLEGQEDHPLTLDVYWTATNKAEVYIGSVDVISRLTKPPVTIILPQSLLNSDGSIRSGFLRVQTQEEYGSALNGQTFSSNYSRLVKVPEGYCGPGVPVDFSLEKRAYSDPERTQLLPAGSVLPVGSTVYFTYVLTNLSETRSTTITEVTDNQKTDGPVCSNVLLAASEVNTTSCTWEQVVSG